MVMCSMYSNRYWYRYQTCTFFLRCVKSSCNCISDSGQTKCFVERSQALEQAKFPPESIFIPECNEDGTFAQVCQRSGSTSRIHYIWHSWKRKNGSSGTHMVPWSDFIGHAAFLRFSLVADYWEAVWKSVHKPTSETCSAHKFQSY